MDNKQSPNLSIESIESGKNKHDNSELYKKTLNNSKFGIHDVENQNTENLLREQIPLDLNEIIQNYSDVKKVKELIEDSIIYENKNFNDDKIEILINKNKVSENREKNQNEIKEKELDISLQKKMIYYNDKNTTNIQIEKDNKNDENISENLKINLYDNQKDKIDFPIKNENNLFILKEEQNTIKENFDNIIKNNENKLADAKKFSTNYSNKNVSKENDKKLSLLNSKNTSIILNNYNVVEINNQEMGNEEAYIHININDNDISNIKKEKILEKNEISDSSGAVVKLFTSEKNDIIDILNERLIEKKKQNQILIEEIGSLKNSNRNYYYYNSVNLKIREICLLFILLKF